MEVPEAEFFNFEAEKSIEKFQVGQIWSLYSDEDCLPKYYGQITKVASDQGFRLWLRWLEPCALRNDVIQWHDKDMIICCGRFRTNMRKSQSYTSAESFSHKNWSAEIEACDLRKCEYEIVEVLEEKDLGIRVSFLEQVDGFNSIFKAQLKEASSVTMEVLHGELLKFSHQIPAFRLTEERGGSLRGFWELDPSALPGHYFARK
ncbi:hypothetical protein GH714_002466 [Hevea brasiliensis]|uniref:DUF3444 domain-containing protein n=1 Tax=Hevea brasiliensis TaxID=3981 RepID=A0A6A6KG19_HEVBR|nr:hypothetical protein GH714_002466 [Hevea brasiliensis]